MRFISSLYNRHKLLKFLRIKPHETDQVGLTVLYALFIGAVQNLVVAVPLALFLAHYNIGFMPYIYISTAFVTLIVGGLFSFFEKRISLERLLKGTLISLGVSLVFLWLWLILSDAKWLFFLLIVWGWVVFNFGNLILGCLINQLFSLQQGKRIYGLIGAGQGMGGIMAGLSLPLFSHFIGPKNVILLIVICLAITLFIQFAIKQRYGDRLAINAHSETTEKSNRNQVNVKQLISKPYILLFFSITVLSVFGYYTLDMLFNTETQIRFVNAVSLASFFGIFFACTDVLNLLMGGFILGWILEKFGVVAALLLLPLTVGSLAILACLTHLIPAAFAFVFWVITLARLLDETFFTSVNEQSLLLLLQPLKPAERIWTNTKSNMVIAPIATAVIGTILLILDKTIGIHLHHFLFILITIYALMTFVLFAIRPYYLKALLNALKKHVLVNPEFKKFDKDSLNVLRKYLQSRFPEEIIYALQTLENTDRHEFIKELPALLTHSDITIKLYILSKIEQHHLTSLRPQLQTICETETNVVVLEKTFVALAAIGNAVVWDTLAKYLENENLSLRTGAIQGLIKYSPHALRGQAFSKLTEMAASPNNEERLLVAKTIQHIKISLPDILLLLLQDSDLSVREAACKAAAGLGEKSLFPLLIENLNIPETRNSAFNSLLTQGNTLIDFINDEFDHYSVEIQCLLIQLLCDFSHKYTIELLFRFIDNSNKRIIHEAIHALTKQKQVIPEAKILTLRKYISQENIYVTHLQKILLGIPFNTQTEILYGFLSREIELGQERILLFLSFFYPVDAILTVRDGFETHCENMVGYATEVLTRTLNVNDMKNIFPTLTFNISHQDDTNKSQSFVNSLETLLKHKHHYYVNEITSALIYTIALLGDEKFLPHISTLAASNPNDRIVQETYQWFLARISIP